ncbi:LrgB family protein [Glaciecola petra]|uniref:LrgB family protein n=1 Tax=Glaciecola petra TaxID=3075602 RepID=A0ABU2ZTF9_9ALTE|nr:LrgB family protein [Aestuariibacter sp. P117]MDT0595922.1 LrgB family protein [Aestuariibacter sp. P117]
MLGYLSEFISLPALLWTLTSVVFYFISLRIYDVCNRLALLHPLILTASLLISLLYLFDQSLTQFQTNTQVLSMLLGPATVALAIPLYSQLKVLLQMNWRVLLPVIVAGIIAPLLSWTSLYLLDAPLDLQMTILVKSITAPLAMDTAHSIGGLPALAAVLVVSTGIVGAIVGPSIFRIIKVNNEAAQGLAMGSISHAIGTARAISISEQCAAFSTLALCINGMVTSIVLPLLFT